MFQHSYAGGACTPSTIQKIKLFVICVFLSGFQTSGFSQVEFMLNLLPDSTTWEVSAQINSDDLISGGFQLASAQATLVVPAGTNIKAVESYNGNWAANAIVKSPIENPKFDYISLGYLSQFPSEAFVSTNRVSLFTFELTPCPDSLKLMDHGDPFARPNSQSTNPNNDFSGFDPRTGALTGWSDNYHPCDWSCNEPCEEQEPQNTSSNSNINASQISIFPNPTTGILHFDDFESSILKIAVRNIFGQTVFQTENPDGQIDLSHLKNGSYFLFFENEKVDFQTKRIIIQK